MNPIFIVNVMKNRILTFLFHSAAFLAYESWTTMYDYGHDDKGGLAFRTSLSN